MAAAAGAASIGGPCKDYGVSHDANPKFRKSMEDEHVVVSPYGDMNTSFFAVYDGHGGDETAKYLGEHLHRTLLQEIAKGKRESVALAVAFAKVDKALEKADVAGDSGATAVTCIIRARDDGRWVYCANCGDARAIIIRKRDEAVQVSKDHKPTDPEEAALLAGKTFVTGGRVGGVLGVSRAFGDFALKEYIRVEPQIAKTEVLPTDFALVIACDGLWDVCENSDIPEIIKGLDSAQAMAEKLVKEALLRGSKDNISVIVVIL